MEAELKPFWNKYFSFNWKFGLFLIFIICIPRFIMVLNANLTNSYSSIALIMIVSALAPFIFLTKYGLKQIGINKPQSFKWLIFAFFTGIFFSVVLYSIGDLLYGDSYSNWYKYIGKSYNIPALIWVLSMFLVSLLFIYFRKKTDSILGAIVCHAGFNLGMTYCIFYLL